MLKEIFFVPLYNALVVLVGIVPGSYVALAIIVLTVVVKLILFPLQTRATRTQLALRAIDPQVRALREKWKHDRAKQAEALWALYREHGISPLSGIIPVLIQIPVVVALFYVFRSGFDFRTDLLYSFVTIPPQAVTTLLGIDVAARSLFLAVFAGVSQFVQTMVILPPLQPKARDHQPSFSDDLARSMHLQMRYVMPVFIAGIAWTLPAALALYWTTSNLFGGVQGWYLKRRFSVTGA